MLTFSRGANLWLPGTVCKKHGNSKFLFSILFLLLFSPVIIYGQCPALSSKNTNIKVDASKGEISISTTVGVNFAASRILLYDYDQPAYYYDSWHRENITNSNKLDIRINPGEIEIKNLPAGDYAIIVDRQGCGRAVLGRGFSGFPDSGIKIE